MSHKLRDRLITVATCFILLCSVPSFGQVLKGSISGTVVDPQGAVVSGATVKATGTETGITLTTTSDSSGSFRFNLIQVGNYKIEVSAQNFETSVQNDILVAAGRDSSVGNIKLKLGEATSTVEVTAEAPLIESTQAQVTNTFEGTVLSSFAGIQENQGLDTLALFVPGVVSARDQGFSNTNGGGGFSVNGLRGRNNDQEIDGQNNNDNSVAGPALALTDSEFVSQYVIVTNNFGPEYGRNAGSVVNLITKSGGNAWHGSVYANENNSILNSLTSTQNNNGLKEPPRSNDEFGGFTIGGPLVKNRAFFFGGFDQEIVGSSTLYSTGSLTPTPTGLATLASCFPSGASANAVAALSKFGPYGISAGNPTPANLTTQDITDPLTNAVLCPNVEVGTVSRILPTPIHVFNWVTKEDISFGGNDQLSARYLFSRGNFFNTQDNGAAGYVVNVPALSQAILLSETHNFSSRMVNEARVGFDRLNVQFGGNSIGTEPTTGGILSAVTNVAFQDPAALGFGVNPALPQGRVVNTWQAQDNWNYVLGKHSLKAGVNWTHQQSPNIFLPNINGAYTFANLSSFIVNNPSDCTPNRDCPSVALAQGNPELGLKENDTFFYVGDDWKIGRNLTLNLGITYSFYGSPYNQLHDLGVSQQQGPNPLWDPTLPLSVTTPAAVPAYKKAIGPSFGFAYSPQWGGFLTGNGKTTIRGGYRLSYDPAFNNILLNNYGGAPSVLETALVGGPGASSALALPAVPTGPNVRALVGPLLPVGQLDPRDLTEVTVGQNFRPDQVQSWSFGVERELSKNSAVEVRYVGNHASQLFQSIDANPFIGDLATQFPNLVPAGDTPCPAANAFSPSAVGRINCNEGIVLSRNNSGYSNYNALQTEFRANNLFHQLTVRAGYTFSKALDNSSEIFSTFGGGNTFAASQNPLDNGHGEYSFSGLDIPHTFSLSVVEDLPLFKGQHGFAGHMLGGWSMSASYVWESGQPFTPETIVFSQLTEAGDFFDSGFDANFNAGVPAARPFLGSLKAPVDSVGIFAGDACALFGAGCSLSSTQLLSLNALNAPTPAVTAVSNNQVRYIANTGVAQSVFGTPFGNAPRNIGRDAPLNFLNASVTKMVKFNERASFEFRFTAQNALNHANFATVNPFIENAGTGIFGNAFALPQLTGDSIPGSNLAASRRFFVGGTFRF
ncbi:MAG TPA: TonB-dependent receptor [Candidatus Angelobacter sp.]|nr:TonB-dependent receptor [Candidatus Angelobacter sp.]